MGTQAYTLLLSTKPIAKNQGFIYKDGMADDVDVLTDDYYYDDEKPTIFLDSTSCRELILDNVEPAFSSAEVMYSAVRCFGEQHHKVAGILGRNKASAKKVSGVLTQIFDTLIEIRSGFLTKKAKPTANPFARSSELNIGSGKIKKVNGYVTMYMPYRCTHKRDGVLFLVLSTVIALLREPRVIKGVIDGSITDAKSLAISLFDIARDRKNKKDTSYNCWMLGGTTSLTQIQAILSESEYNGDGSDYASIAALALFILAYTSGMPMVTPDMDDINGPISYLEECFDQSHLETIVNMVKSWGVDLSFLRNIADNSYMGIAEVYVETIGASLPDEGVDEFGDMDYDDDEW